MPRERVHHGKLTAHWKDPDVDFEDGKGYPGAEVSASYSPQDPPPFPPDVPVEITGEPSLDVLWNRDGCYVQVAIDAPRDWWKKWLESYDGSPELPSFPAYTDVLSRRELNDLIRVLRRARDAAYGRDE